MLIENNIEDSVNFFHLDALSSAVALKVNCDVQLTLMASSLYRYLGQKIGHGFSRLPRTISTHYRGRGILTVFPHGPSTGYSTVCSGWLITY